MLIWNEGDPVIPVSHAQRRRTRTCPASRLVVFPSGGHEPHRRNARAVRRRGRGVHRHVLICGMKSLIMGCAARLDGERTAALDDPGGRHVRPGRHLLLPLRHPDARPGAARRRAEPVRREPAGVRADGRPAADADRLGRGGRPLRRARRDRVRRRHRGRRCWRRRRACRAPWRSASLLGAGRGVRRVGQRRERARGDGLVPAGTSAAWRWAPGRPRSRSVSRSPRSGCRALARAHGVHLPCCSRPPCARCAALLVFAARRRPAARGRAAAARRRRLALPRVVGAGARPPGQRAAGRPAVRGRGVHAGLPRRRSGTGTRPWPAG